MVLAGLLFWIAYTAVMVIADDCKAKCNKLSAPATRLHNASYEYYK